MAAVLSTTMFFPTVHLGAYNGLAFYNMGVSTCSMPPRAALKSRYNVLSSCNTEMHFI